MHVFAHLLLIWVLAIFCLYTYWASFLLFSSSFCFLLAGSSVGGGCIQECGIRYVKLYEVAATRTWFSSTGNVKSANTHTCQLPLVCYCYAQEAVKKMSPVHPQYQKLCATWWKTEEKTNREDLLCKLIPPSGQFFFFKALPLLVFWPKTNAKQSHEPIHLLGKHKMRIDPVICHSYDWMTISTIR